MLVRASPSGIALKKLLHRFGLRIAAIAAVALLLAQLGAMTHAYSHDAVAGGTQTHQQQPGNHEVCADCLNFAPLLSAAGAPAALPFIEPQSAVLAPDAELRSLLDQSPYLAFRSRAPPATH
jgi:hypothetical protein